MESRLRTLEADVGIIKSTMATRESVAQAETSIVKWLVGTAVVLGGTGITVMSFVLNNAIPKPVAPAAPVAAPIVIQVPYPQAAIVAQPQALPLKH